MQVSPIGMASASQADFGGSDSRHLLHLKGIFMPFFIYLTNIRLKILKVQRRKRSYRYCAQYGEICVKINATFWHIIVGSIL